MAKTSRYPKVAPDARLRVLSNAVLRTLWKEMNSEALQALEGDEEAVHDVRVAIRRLRSALRTFRDCYPRDARRPVAKHMRRLGRVMGAVRDADVHLTILRLALAASAPSEVPGVEFVIERVSEQRGRSLAEALDGFASLDSGMLERMLADG